MIGENQNSLLTASMGACPNCGTTVPVQHWFLYYRLPTSGFPLLEPRKNGVFLKYPECNIHQKKYWRFPKWGIPSRHHGCFNTKSWSSMSWMIWGYPHGLETTNDDFATSPPWALVHHDPPPPVHRGRQIPCNSLGLVRSIHTKDLGDGGFMNIY